MAVPNGRDGLPVALNPRRPSNPFGLTDEPDWVSVSTPKHSTGYSNSSLSSSPYENVLHPMAALASSRQGLSQQHVPRKKLPPPYDAAKLPAQVGRLRVDDHDIANGQSMTLFESHSNTTSAPPPLPPPRRHTAVSPKPNLLGPTSVSGANLTRTQTLPHSPMTPFSAAAVSTATASRTASTAVSTTSQVSQLSQQLTNKSSSKTGKSPPPVGKKPAHLATGSPSPSPSASPSPSLLSSRLALAAAGDTHRKPVGVAQQHSQLVAGQLSGAMNGGSHARNHLQPAVSLRGHQQKQRQGPGGALVDLLDAQVDEGGEEVMGGWEALKPSSRV